MKLRPGLLLAAAFGIMVCMSSCVREYVCQCEIVYSGAPGLPDTVLNEYRVSDTKKNAKSVCESNSGTYEVDGIKAVEKCALY